MGPAILRAASVSFLVAAASVAVASAARHELPAKTRLSGGIVALDLQDADLRVSIEETADSILAVDPPRDVSETVFVEVEQGTDGLRIVPIPGGPRLRAELRLRPNQRLVLRGRRVAIRIVRQLDPDGGGTEDAPEESDQDDFETRSVELRLTASEADLESLDAVQIKASDSSVWIREGTGELDLELAGGVLEVRSHRGTINADLKGLSVDVLGLVGGFTADLARSDLRVDGGTGAVQVTGNESDVMIAHRRGVAKIEAKNGRLVIRDVDRSGRPWTVSGEDLQASVERFGGPLEAKLDGGTLDVREFGGSLKVEGAGNLEAVVEDVEGDVELQLLGGAVARLSDLGKHLDAEVADGSLSVAGVRRLTLQSERSDIDISGVRILQRLAAVDSSLTADLTELASGPNLDLAGNSDATFWLRTPCVVAVRTDDPDRASQVRVTSCDLRMPGQPIRATRSRLIHGHRQPMVLTVAIEDGVHVIAEGRTVD